ncbi:MAG: hypothetical protein ABIL39_10800 [candidate division WOR-3 bacterium]
MKYSIRISLCIMLFLATAFAQEPNLVWQKTYGGNLADEGYSITTTNDGGFIIGGYTYSSPENRNAYLIKTDAFGNIQWHKIFGTQYDDAVHCVRQTADGNYILTGAYDEYNPNKGSDIYLRFRYLS